MIIPGKVLEGFSAAPLNFVDDDAGDHLLDALIMSRQPPQKPGNKHSDVPDSWTDCILYGFAKKDILSTPGFSKPVRWPALPLHEIRETTDGQGLGVFAVKDISMGDIIFVERPLFMEPVALPQIRIRNQLGLNWDIEQIKQGMMEYLCKSFEKWPEERQKAFMALANSHLHDGSDPLQGIIRTNGFGVEVRNPGTTFLSCLCENRSVYLGFKVTYLTNTNTNIQTSVKH
jgi:hypothetical protein